MITKMVWESEYQIWEKYYPKGKYVLDVGADKESETFFKQHGAIQVHTIGDEYGSHVDSIKIDIEGSEWGMIIETHGADPKLTLLHDWKNGAKIYRLDKKKEYGMKDRRFIIKRLIVKFGKWRHAIRI